MGPGAASLSPGAREAAVELSKKGIPIVAVARPATGTGVPSVNPGPVYVDGLDPSPLRKIRILTTSAVSTLAMLGLCSPV